MGCHHISVDSSAPSILPPGFQYQAHHLCFFNFKNYRLYVFHLKLECEKNKNKRKEGGTGPFKKTWVLGTVFSPFVGFELRQNPDSLFSLSLSFDVKSFREKTDKRLEAKKFKYSTTTSVDRSNKLWQKFTLVYFFFSKLKTNNKNITFYLIKIGPAPTSFLFFSSNILQNKKFRP